MSVNYILAAGINHAGLVAGAASLAFQGFFAAMRTASASAHGRLWPVKVLIYLFTQVLRNEPNFNGLFTFLRLGACRG